MINYVHRGQPLRISADDWNQMARAVNALGARMSLATPENTITDIISISPYISYPYALIWTVADDTYGYADLPLSGDRGRARLRYTMTPRRPYGQPAITQPGGFTAVIHGLTLARFSSWNVGEHYAIWRNYDAVSGTIPEGTLQGTTERTPIRVLSNMPAGSIEGQPLLWILLDGQEVDQWRTYGVQNIVAPYNSLAFHAGADGVSITAPTNAAVATNVPHNILNATNPVDDQYKLQPYKWPSLPLTAWPASTSKLDVSLVVWYKLNTNGTLADAGGIGWQLGSASPAPSSATRRVWKVATAYKDGLWQWTMQDIPIIVDDQTAINALIKRKYSLLDARITALENR